MHMKTLRRRSDLDDRYWFTDKADLGQTRVGRKGNTKPGSLQDLVEQRQTHLRRFASRSIRLPLKFETRGKADVTERRRFWLFL